MTAFGEASDARTGLRVPRRIAAVGVDEQVAVERDQVRPSYAISSTLPQSS
jgi:hypothetical protein